MNGPTARGRLWASVLAIGGAAVARDPLLLFGGYALGVVPCVLIGRVWKAHLYFATSVVLPVAVLAGMVWPVLIGAPPGATMGSDGAGAIRFVCATVLRLLFLGGVAQACVLSVGATELASTFRRWGLRGEWLIGALGAMTLGPEVRRRADRSVTAALARGLLPNRRLWSRIRILPLTLVPLMTWSVRSAIDRADHWHDRNFTEHIERLASETDSGSWSCTVALLLAAVAWMIVTVGSRWGSAWVP